MEALSDAQVALFHSSGSLSDYSILKPIGKGKFSVVYRAKRNRDDVLVALKKIAINIMDKKSREKTLKEVKLVQSVHHPNIIQYLDAFIADKELCIAFEWAEAGDLKRQIRKANEKGTRFEERLIWKYFAQIAAAIQHMHNHRIMHRDIKPANIFLMLSGHVKVGDLGLGRHLSENTMEAHSKVGTPLYMSPEVLRGDGYDWKCDVWSLGCILYELAMLRSPFKSEGLNLYGLFQKVNKGDYEPVASVYSTTLQQLVSQMLALNANDRPTMQEICATSQQCVDGIPAKIHPSTLDNQQEALKPPSSVASTPVGSRESTPNNAPEASPRTDNNAAALTLMDIVFEKLKLLGFQAAVHKVPLSPIYFALEHPRHQQFKHWLCIVGWLSKQLEMTLDVALDSAFDPPLRKATAILVGLSAIGFDDASSISPASLTCGFGLSPTLVLKAMCDKALKPLVSTRSPLNDQEDVYPDVDESLEWKDDEESIALASSAEDDNVPFVFRGEVEINDSRVFDHIVNPASCINRDAWLLEVAKNISKLQSALSSRPSNVPSWWMHLESLHSYAQSKFLSQISFLPSMHSNLHADLQALSIKEKRLNDDQIKYRNLYQRHFDAQYHLQQRMTLKENLRNSLSKDLSTLQSTIASNKAALHEINSTLTDSSQLIRLKSAVKAMDDDIKKMDLAIALKQAMLFHSSTNHHTRLRQSTRSG